MAVNLSPVGGAAAQFFDNNGIPLAGGLLYTYAAGTSTPLATYTTQQATVLNSNPIVLDSAGRVPNEIWLTSTYAYKFVLQNASGVQVWSYDNLVGINSNFTAYSLQEQTFTATQGQTVFTLTGISYVPGTNNLSVFVNGSKQIVSTNYLETSSTVVTFLTGLNVGDVVDFITAISTSTTATTANNISYTQGSTGSTTTNVQAKLQQTVSVKDFGAVGDGTTDDTVAFANAITASNSVYVPEGTYLVDYIWIGKNGFTLRGAGVDATIIKARSVVNRLFKIQYALNNATDPAATINYTSIGGFTINGNSKADIGLYTVASECQELINNVKIINTLVTGHQHWRGYTNNVYGLQITNNAGDGLRMDNEANNTNWFIEVNNNTGIGVQVFSGNSISITGGIEGHGKQGIVIKSTPNTSGGLYVPTNVTLLKLDNVYVEGNCTTNTALGNIEVGAGTNVTQNVLLNNVTINVFNNAIGLYIKSSIQYLQLNNVNVGTGTGCVVWDSSYTTYYSLVYGPQSFKNVFVNGGVVVIGNTALNQQAANLIAGGGSSSYPFVSQATGTITDFVGAGGAGLAGDGVLNFWRQSQLTGTVQTLPNVGFNIQAQTPTTGYLSFSNASGEVARVSGDARFLVGATSAVGNGLQEISFLGGVYNGLVINNSNGAGTPSHIVFKYSGTTVGSISCTASTTTYATSSDYRLKEAVLPMTGALNTIAKLKPITYKWKINGSDGQGFIAHELQEVCPDAVTGIKDAVDAEGKPVYQGIDTSFLVATLVAAIQELKAEIDLLKTK